MSRTAIAILSTENMLHNLKIIKNMVKPAKIIAMVKANAYGHGIRSVSLKLDKYVDMLGVASIDEALALRKSGVSSPIMLCEGVFEQSELIIASTEKFHTVFHNELQIDWLEKSFLPTPLQSWIKIDTGMGRLGFSVENAQIAFDRINNNKNIDQPVRIMSHFACADDISHPLNNKQIIEFEKFIKNKNTEFSLCNSAGIFNFPNHYYHYVRPGICLYGISPISGISSESLNLKPVMTIQTSIIAIKNMKKNSSIGYGARYICEENMPVGIIAFGYGDGYPITTHDGAFVLINNIKCKIIGRISMDMMAIDLRPYPDAKILDPVILWGDNIHLENIAQYTSNLTYDMLTSIQNRVKFLWTRM